MTEPAENYPPGPGVDAVGRTVVDPSDNVRALNEAGVKRLDDLRHAAAQMAAAEHEHLRELVEVRSIYEERLRQAETARIDAIRAVDVGAVQRAAEVAAAQAEALRNQVAAAATATAAALAAALDPIQKSIDDLRRAQYEAQGVRSNVVEARAGTGLLVAAIGVGITVLLAIVGLVGYVSTQGSSPDPIIVEVPATP